MNEDILLLEAFKKGDKQAFERLVIKYKQDVFKMIYSIAGNVSEADDIAQEVFLRVYNNAASFKNESSFSTWLYRITVNKCYDEMKKKKNKFVSLESELGQNEFSRVIDVLKSNEPSVESELVQQELQEAVKKAVFSLPEKYSKALTLIDIENFSYIEAADIMKVPVNKLKVWLFRARNKLKTKLKPVYDLYMCPAQDEQIGSMYKPAEI